MSTPSPPILAFIATMSPGSWQGRYPGGAVGARVPDPLPAGPWLIRFRDDEGEHVGLAERNWQQDPPPDGVEINPGYVAWAEVMSWTPLWELI